MSAQVLIRSGLAACRGGLVVVALFSLALNLLMLAVPLYTMSIYDRVLTSRSAETLLMISAIAVGALVIIGILETIRQMVTARLGAKLETTLGGPLLALSLKSDGSAEGDVLALRDLASVRQLIASPIVGALFDLPVAPLYLAVLFLVHPHLGWLALGFAVLICAVALLNERLTREPLAEASKETNLALRKAQIQSRNGEVIRAMGMFPEALDSWGESNARALSAADRAARRNAVLNGVSQFLRLVLQVAILGYGAYLMLADASVSGGILFAAALISARALGPLNQVVAGWRTLAAGAEAWARIQREISRLPEDAPAMSLPAPTATLEVEKLFYRPDLASEPIVKGLSFTVPAGEIVGIIGPSGAGKSTLARLIVGALRPSAGIVRIGGDDRSNWAPEDIGPYIGYVPQDVELFPATVAQNIARMSQDPDPEQVIAAAKLANCHELIQRLPKGYDTPLGMNGFGLSGGERQRIALARAFFGKPRLVVLDEPNASLDAEGEQALIAALQQARAQGITCLVISQRASVVPALTQIILMREGRIEAYGPREEVLKRQMRRGGPEIPTPQTVTTSFTGSFFG